ncbi:MAG: hypothetical protein Q8S84_09535 [bacterium]|nr:hypothetical protein [bacterium]MDP3381657.1 hypothetical protein [bacterium]
MTEIKLRYECPVCGKEYKKEELDNGKLPIHIFNKVKCYGTSNPAKVSKK